MVFRRYLAILLAATALVAAAGVAAVTGWEAYRLWSQAEPAPASLASLSLSLSPSPPPPADEPIAELAPIVTADLTDPKPDAPSGFVWLPEVKPEDFCKALGSMGLPRPDFQHGEGAVRGWSCVADLMKPVEGDDAKASSLFVSARGENQTRVDGFRIKLNLLDPVTTPVVKSFAKGILDSIFQLFGWRAPDPVLDAIETAREGVLTINGVRFDLKKEFGGDARYNLVVTFPERIGTGGEDRFLPKPLGGYRPG